MQLTACSPERPPKTRATRGRAGCSGVAFIAGQATAVGAASYAAPVPDPSLPLSPATVAVTAGRPPAEPDAPLNTPLVFTSTYVASPGAPRPGDLGYGRWTNPTWEAFEAALGALEGGRALLFSAGMAAVAAVVDLVPDGGARRRAHGRLQRHLDAAGGAGGARAGAGGPGGRRRHGRRPRRPGRRGRAALARDADESAARGRGPARARRRGARRGCARRRRQHVRDAARAAAARARGGRRRALGDEVPRGAQ